MAASPPKPDYLSFHQFGVLDLWARADAEAAAARPFVDIVPLRAVTERFRHMSCDGMHHLPASVESEHGAAWQCPGFPQVHDVAWQMYLHRLLRNATVRAGCNVP